MRNSKKQHSNTENILHEQLIWYLATNSYKSVGDCAAMYLTLTEE